MIGIIDYGMGNIFSIKNACSKVNLNSKIINKPDNLDSFDALILPGVGAFKDAISKLKENGLDQAILNFFHSGKTILGICLGMQLLMSKSYEFGEHDGLNLIEGSCFRFPTVENNKKVLIPQITWNNIFINEKFKMNELFYNIKNNEYMYFVHSYYVEPINKDIIATTTQYGGLYYCSSFIQSNLIGIQFHPERSSLQGLRFYENFKKLIYKRC